MMDWLRAAPNVNDDLVNEILDYEASIDSEFGCCHDRAAIEAGRCRRIKPDEIPALQIIAMEAGWKA
jgi:hypothetical protein